MAPRPLHLLLALAAGAFGGLCWLGTVPGSLDDLFLVLRAARDPLARGDWAVLGCSSLLDVGLKRVVLSLAVHPEVAAPWAGLVLHGLGCAWLFLECAGAWEASSAAPGLTRGGRQGSEGPWGRGIRAVGLVALAFAAGALPSEAAAYQLEGPVLLLSLLGLHRASGRSSPALLAVACVGLSWARPEGALLALAWSLQLAPRRLRWVGAVSVAVALALWGGLLALLSPLPWPDAALPLSFHVKHGDWGPEVLAGLSYLAEWLRSPGGLGVLLLLGVGLTGGGGLPSRLALLAVVVVVVEGGDGYLGARLWMPAAVLALLGASEALGRAAGGSAGRVAAVALLLVLLDSMGALREGLRVAPSLVAGQGAGELTPLGLERELAAGLRRLQQEAGRELTIVHRDQQVLLWLDPELRVRDASGLSDPEVAALPAPGAVRHGRDAFAALAPGGDLMLLDHQRVRAASWTGRSLEVVLLAEADAWIGPPRTREEVAAWEGEWVTVSLACGEAGWVNALVRRELVEAAGAAGWAVGAEPGAVPRAEGDAPR